MITICVSGYKITSIVLLIINELIALMGLNVLRSLLYNIKNNSNPWFSLLVDEATDIMNREQLDLSIRWVNEDYVVREDSIGLYSLPNTTAETLYTVVTDMLTRCTLPLELCRGMAFDGAANMQGKQKGLVTRIKQQVPKAVFVHCFAHCLNLCLQEAGRKLLLLCGALDTVREKAKLIKFSPKRAHLFSVKLAEAEDSGVSIKNLCPTRWTVRTEAIGAVLSDYSFFMDTLEEVHRTTHDEYGLKADGLLNTLEKFSTMFGLKLGYLIFGASETLSKSLQSKDTSVQEALNAVNIAKDFYKRQRTDDAFNAFYDDAIAIAQKVNIDGPSLPRYRKAPQRLDDGVQPHRYATPQDYFRHQYFEACDLLMTELDEKFEQQQIMPPILALENILLKASNSLTYEKDIEIARKM